MDTLEPTGSYHELMDRLSHPDKWDVPGIISDIRDSLLLEDHMGDVLAVIDTLLFRMKDIADRISPVHAKRIDPNTIREAARIAEMFVSK